MRYVINNVGDPFHDSNFQSNTHEIEREVIGIFADLMHISREDGHGATSRRAAPRATCTVSTWGANSIRTA